MIDNAVQPEAVPVGLLRRYLRAQGWQRGSSGRKAAPTIPAQFQKLAATLQAVRGMSARGGFDIWELRDQGGDPIQVMVPTNTQAPEFLERIERAINIIATVEQRPPDRVAASIRGVGFDLVHSKVPDSLVFDDSIALAIASNYIADIQELLTATANTEIQPTAFYPRAKKGAIEYANSCRFGHTFRGSFGFTIESPIEENSTPMLPEIPESPPFERRVIQRLARGVRAAVQAVETNDIRPIVDSMPQGFGANACEKFAKLIVDTSPGGLTMSFAFSPEWRAADEFTGTVEYRVDARHAEITLTAAKALRNKPFSRPEKIKGRIVNLYNETDPNDLLHTDGEREITVHWQSEDLGDIDVHIVLTPEEYLRAYEAHGKGQEVSSAGTLERKGRNWILTSLTQFDAAGAKNPGSP
jgi:hypothetical protein